MKTSRDYDDEDGSFVEISQDKDVALLYVTTYLEVQRALENFRQNVLWHTVLILQPFESLSARLQRHQYVLMLLWLKAHEIGKMKLSKVVTNSKKGVLPKKGKEKIAKPLSVKVKTLRRTEPRGVLAVTHAVRRSQKQGPKSGRRNGSRK